jgi:glycosyltransferase involved in cell wall biosynthesis
MTKNILLYTPNIYPKPDEIGGVETCTLATLKRLNRDRFRPIVLMHAEGPFLDELQRAGVDTVYIPVSDTLRRLSRANTASNFVALSRAAAGLYHVVRQVIRVIREWKIDLVHCNHPYAYLCGGIAARCVGAPSIWHFHEEFEPGPARTFTLTAARHLARHIIAITPATASMFGSGTGFPPITVIYNGFDFDEFRGARSDDTQCVRREFGIGPDELLIGYVSHLAPYKGQAVFLEAMARVVRRIPGARAMIVGAARKSCETFPARLRSQAASLEIGSQVIFTGMRRDIPDIMNAFDLFACVSATEDFNRVMVEAMCLAKPTIISDVNGAPVVVRDGDTGLLVPPRDPERLAEAILRLAVEPELRQRLGNAGRRFVEETFSIDSIIAQYERVYDQVIISRCKALGTRS